MEMLMWGAVISVGLMLLFALAVLVTERYDHRHGASDV
jgi:hypothetical protein